MNQVEAVRFAINQLVDSAQGKSEQVDYLEGVSAGSDAHKWARKQYDDYSDAISALRQLLDKMISE
jgi:hypothetical protein